MLSAKQLDNKILIIGAGMVGLSLANQLVDRQISNDIVLIEKEVELGLHSSGRNSGVLHSGLYYKPNSLKARVCINGAKRLKKWIKERKLPLLNCGKLIVPTKPKLDNMIDILYQRGLDNGVEVRVLSKNELQEIVPIARSASGRGLWSPNTSVTKPMEILNQLEKELQYQGVQIIKSAKIVDLDVDKQFVNIISNNQLIKINYHHLFNCSGLQADRVAKSFNVGHDLSLLPFKGLYWKLKKSSNISLSTNLYPVPDLNFPFLGIHFTPSADSDPIINIGPTAIPAFGRENYNFLEGIEPLMLFRNLGLLLEQYYNNNNGFRNYAHDQLFLSLLPLLIKEIQLLIPTIQAKDIEISKKVGIRAQLFNKKSKTLVDDFVCMQAKSSTHILNAISPAFTASFELADLIIDEKIKHHL